MHLDKYQKYLKKHRAYLDTVEIQETLSMSDGFKLARLAKQKVKASRSIDSLIKLREKFGDDNLKLSGEGIVKISDKIRVSLSTYKWTVIGCKSKQRWYRSRSIDTFIRKADEILG